MHLKIKKIYTSVYKKKIPIHIIIGLYFIVNKQEKNLIKYYKYLKKLKLIKRKIKFRGKLK